MGYTTQEIPYTGQATINVALEEDASKLDEVVVVGYGSAVKKDVTGAVESDADTLDKVIIEIATTRTTERGTRADDKRGETAMEDRKKQGYF
mgnify:CR=1 FL=1